VSKKKNIKNVRIYTEESVYEAALKRFEFLFEEFDRVIVNISGGKDSTIVMELALIVARKLNRLPLEVMFFDQEAEIMSVIEYIRRIQARDEIKFHWYQIPITINTSASISEQNVICWDETKEDLWVREKEKDSIKSNVYYPMDTYFNKCFNFIAKKDFVGKDGKSCMVGGVRAEESVIRMAYLSKGAVYKGVTWGKNTSKDRYVFYPIYDWSYTDVWKFIYDNNIEYADYYNLMYKKQVAIQDMRVSCVFHENSVKALEYLSEYEPENWNRISARIVGANTYKTLKGESYTRPKQLPYMFRTWRDYFLHLLVTVIEGEDLKKKYVGMGMSLENYIRKNALKFTDKQDEIEKDVEYGWKIGVSTLLKNDFCGTLISNFKIKILPWLGDKYEGKNEKQDKEANKRLVTE